LLKPGKFVAMVALTSGNAPTFYPNFKEVTSGSITQEEFMQLAHV
jgi:hypothetical protein